MFEELCICGGKMSISRFSETELIEDKNLAAKMSDV